MSQGGDTSTRTITSTVPLPRICTETGRLYTQTDPTTDNTDDYRRVFQHLQPALNRITDHPYEVIPTFLRNVSGDQGRVICIRCQESYRSAMTAHSEDPHSQQCCWMRDYAYFDDNWRSGRVAIWFSTAFVSPVPAV